MTEQTLSSAAAAPPRPAAMPFRGPRPYGESDGPTFVGRDKEAAQLADLVLARPEVVLHGPAGRGKTSLIRAGLLPRLRQRGCRVLPTPEGVPVETMSPAIAALT